MANVTSPTAGRVETQLYDHIFNISGLTIIVSFILFMMGRGALRTTVKQKAKVAQRMFRRNFFFFCAFLVFYVFTRKQSRSFMTVYQSLTDGDKNETTIVANMTNDVAEESKRNLRAVYKRYNVPEESQDMLDGMFESDIDEIDQFFKRNEWVP